MLSAPAPFVRNEPGATYDALGEVDGISLVDIEKTKEHPQYQEDGQLRILTVYEWGGPLGAVTVADALRVLFDQSITLQPVEFLYPEEVDPDQIAEEGRMEFVSAQNLALAAALTELGIDIRSWLQVVSVADDGPAAKVLKPRDELLAIGSMPITDFVSLDAAMSGYKIGDKVTLTVKRGGVEKKVKVTLGDNGEGEPRIGIFLMISYVGPMDIKLQLDNVGGPSAGLAFTLAIYERLTPGSLLNSRVVAVTGTIDVDGSVGPIGGVHQKLAAASRANAELMLLPRDNCDALVGEDLYGLKVVPVATLKEAIAVLESPQGAELPTCETDAP